MQQMKESCNGKFLFPEDAFVNFDKINPGFHLFEDNNERWAYSKPLFGNVKPLSQDEAYDKFLRKFVTPKEDTKTQTRKYGREELLARLFGTITNLKN